MILYPAIDILKGRAVRLVQGDFTAPTVYGEEPLAMAHRWVSRGARALHVVDLDGARQGEPVNLSHVQAIAGSVAVPVQVGGGLRDLPAVAAALDAGAARVVVGTAAYRDTAFLEAIVTEHGDRVAVAVDVRAGTVSAVGWRESTGQDPATVLAGLRRRGVSAVVYTDVDRDGMLSGPDVPALERLLPGWEERLIYSGGIGQAAHLEALAALPLAGVIVGKALYEHRFSFAEGQAALGS